MKESGKDRQNPGDQIGRLLGELDNQEEIEAIRSESIEHDFDLASATAGRYTYVRELGSGGMARVILASDTALKREVAVKVLDFSADEDNAGEIARFVHEAQITAELAHPGIVPVYDLGSTHGRQHFFIMLPIEGKSLRQLLDESSLDSDYRSRMSRTSHLLNLFVRVCQAMGYAHHKGISHLDLKPENIMSGPFGEVFVMDWGIARKSGTSDDEAPSGDHLFDPGLRELRGTPGFIPPEQLVDSPENPPGPSCDVFALGGILFEILSGRKPFPEGSSEEVRRAVMSNERSTVSRATMDRGCKKIPGELAAICETALAPDPGSRYSTAGGLGDDVEAYLENRAVTAFEENRYHRMKRWMRRHQAAAGAILAMATVAVIALVALLCGHMSELHYRCVLEERIEDCRMEYVDANCEMEWLARRMNADTDLGKDRQEDLERVATRQLLATQHLRIALEALLATQRPDVDREFAEELRGLWIEEMDLALKQGNLMYACMAFERMQKERGSLPWWDWEPDEFGEVETLRNDLKKWSEMRNLPFGFAESGEAELDSPPERRPVPQGNTE